MTRPLFFGLALGITTVAGAAEAQYPPPPPPPPAYGYPAPAPAALPRHFGSPGQLAISSDASLGLTGTTTGGVDGSPSTSGWNLTIAPAADYFVIQGLSVGGFVDFTHTEVSSPNLTNGQPNNTGSTSVSTNTFGLGPRVGYNIPFNDWLSIWPKLGLGFYDQSTTGEGSGTRWTLSIYAPILYHLATHYFVGLGPELLADLGANESNNGKTGPAAKVVTYGLTFTVGGWFQP